MAATVPVRRPEPVVDEVLVGQIVSYRTWQACAFLGNWLRGKGSCLIPWTFPECLIEDAGAETFHFRVKTRNAAVQRVWCLLVRGSGPIVVKTNGGSPFTYSISSTSDGLTPIVHVETLASQASTETALTLEITAAEGLTATVEGIACYEQDRPVLQLDSTDYGADAATVRSGDPIFYSANQSMRGVLDALTNSDARRVGLYHWSVGNSLEANRSTASYDNVLQLGVPLLARKLARSAVTGSVKWAAYAKVAGGSGAVRVTTTESGVSDEVTVTSTSFAWTTARSISIDCDDMTATDGRQGSAWDELNFAIKGDGSNALTIAALSIWDDS